MRLSRSSSKNDCKTDSRYQLVNGAWERTLGWSLNEIVQQDVDVFALLYPDPQARRQVQHFIQNPFDLELLWEKMFRGTLNYGRKGVVLEAISAIDIAIWDNLGKATGQPVYNLLGGKTRERIPVYASRLYAHQDLDWLAAQADSFRKRGFRAMKQRFGYGPQDGLPGMRRNVELVRTVRDAVGPDIELMADAYMGWDVTL